MAKTEKTEASPKFQRKAPVTLPLLKLVIDKPAYVKITSEIRKSKPLEGAKGKEGMEPADIMNVINLETGEQCEMIVNKVLAGTLDESFPDASYVNKCFELTKLAKKEDKRYHTFEIWEIDEPK